MLNWYLDFEQSAENSVKLAMQAHVAEVNFGDGSETQVCLGRKKYSGQAEFRNGWFRLEAPLADDYADLSSSTEIWSTLGRARDLHGAKIILPAGSARPIVRAEFSVDDIEVGDAAVAETRVRNACQAIEKALSRLAKNDRAKPDDPVAGESRLTDQLREYSWQFTAGGNGRLSVDLEVANGCYQAEFWHVPEGLRISVPVLMAGCQDNDEACRHALGLLLLRAGTAIRMAGAVARSIEDEVVPCFQVVVPAEPGGALVIHALAGLSVICELFAAEAELVSQDAGIARAYLAMQGVPDS